MSQDTYNLVSTILGGLTLAAAFGTLLYLRKYTQATRDQVSALEATSRAAAATARVASEQVEATSKPCLLISTSEPQADRGAETASTVLPRRGIVLLNVGNGPAIDVQVKFEHSRQGGEPTAFPLPTTPTPRQATDDRQSASTAMPRRSAARPAAVRPS